MNKHFPKEDMQMAKYVHEKLFNVTNHSAQFGSATQSCLTLRAMDCGTPVFPVHHQLPELAQTHVHWVSDAIQPSHPLPSLSPPAFLIFPSIRVFPNEWVASDGASASASVLPMIIQDWFPLGGTGWISLQSKGLSRVFSNTTVQKHRFFGAQLSLWSQPHIHVYYCKEYRFDYMNLCQQSNVSAFSYAV